MKRQENIHVSLQLEKDASSGELMIAIQFDRNAPNFFTNKNMISWCPTNEELEFVNQAYGMLHKSHHHRNNDMDEPEQDDTDSEEPLRTADEKEILNRVFEKKRPAYK